MGKTVKWSRVAVVCVGLVLVVAAAGCGGRGSTNTAAIQRQAAADAAQASQQVAAEEATCNQSMAVAAADPNADLTPTLHACAGVDMWLSAAAAHPGVAIGNTDPRAVLYDTCKDGGPNEQLAICKDAFKRGFHSQGPGPYQP